MAATLNNLFLTPLFAATVGFLALSAVASFAYHRVAGPSRRLLLITGAVGTPVHELAHAVVALLFGMRVDKIDFYRPDPASSQLGSVTFRYNPNSPLHRVGLFAVGLAPLFIGALAVEALFRSAGLSTLPAITPSSATSLNGIFSAAKAAGAGNALLLLNAGWIEWLTVIAAYCIALHSFPSRADLGHAGRGLIFIALFALILGALGVSETHLSQFIQPMLPAVAHALLAFSQLAIVATLGSLCLVPIVFVLGAARRAFLGG